MHVDMQHEATHSLANASLRQLCTSLLAKRGNRKPAEDKRLLDVRLVSLRYFLLIGSKADSQSYTTLYQILDKVKDDTKRKIKPHLLTNQLL